MTELNHITYYSLKIGIDVPAVLIIKYLKYLESVGRGFLKEAEHRTANCREIYMLKGCGYDRLQGVQVGKKYNFAAA